MENFVETYLKGKGYNVNSKAQAVIKECDNWYANRVIEDFHEAYHGARYSVSAEPDGICKRCCADDANLCEIAEVNGGNNKEQHEYLVDILAQNRFLPMFRKQIESVSAKGTAACYVRLDNADIMSDNTVRGGNIRLNYVSAENFIPLTVENDEVTGSRGCGNGTGWRKSEDDSC